MWTALEMAKQASSSNIDPAPSPRPTGPEASAAPPRQMIPEEGPDNSDLLQSHIHVSTRNTICTRNSESPLTGQDEEGSEGGRVEHESLDSWQPPPHHRKSPRTHGNRRTQQAQKTKREVDPRTSRGNTRQRGHRQLQAQCERGESSPVASSSKQSYKSLSPLTPLPSSSPIQPQSASLSQSISGSPSTSVLPSEDHHEIVVRHPQTTGSRRPALDISSERLRSSLRNQLHQGQLEGYAIPHPKRDGSVTSKKWRCAYELEAGRCNVACSRKGEARRHAFTHEAQLRWICPSLAGGGSCGKLFARQDSAIRHVLKSKTCKTLAANRAEGIPVLVTEEDGETVVKIITLEWIGGGEDNEEDD